MYLGWLWIKSRNFVTKAWSCEKWQAFSWPMQWIESAPPSPPQFLGLMKSFASKEAVLYSQSGKSGKCFTNWKLNVPQQKLTVLKYIYTLLPRHSCHRRNCLTSRNQTLLRLKNEPSSMCQDDVYTSLFPPFLSTKVRNHFWRSILTELEACIFHNF